MQGIVGAKTDGFDFPRAFDSCSCQRNRYVGASEHAPDAMPPFTIWGVGDFFFHDSATDPMPFAGFAVLQNQEDRFSFQPYTVLALVVKGTVQATDIKIDLYHLKTLL